MDLFDTDSTQSQDSNYQSPFKLERDIVFFDIESTGLNVMQDKIIQIALIKHFANGNPPAELELLMNPEIAIGADAQAIHGISAEDVADKPPFKAFAKEIMEFIGDSDLGGYNSDRFDLPMLSEELARCDIDLDIESRRTVDVQKIFYKMEPRTLKAAYKKFCNKTLVDAHDALADVRATVDVFAGQLKAYEGVDYEDGDGFVTTAPISNDIGAIHEFIKDPSRVDFTNRLKRNANGEIVFNFGKYANQKVEEVFKKDRNYYHWIQQKDFSTQVKKITLAIMTKIIEDASKQ